MELTHAPVGRDRMHLWRWPFMNGGNSKLLEGQVHAF